MHNLFRVFALLNLRLHRRVKLLVLESSLLEFRVLVISCHAAAAPSSSPCHLPPLLIRHRSESVSIYHHRCHILPSYIHHQSEFFSYSVCFRDPSIFRFVFPCLSRSRKKKESGDPRAVFRPKFRQPKIFFPYPIFRPRVVF